MNKREKNQKAWVRKNLKRGVPATVDYDNGDRTYGIFSKNGGLGGQPVFEYRTGVDGLGLIMSETQMCERCKISKKENENGTNTTNT